MKKILCLLCCVISLPVTAATVRYVVATDAPVALTLPVGVDKIVTFAHPVKVMIPNNIQSNMLSIGNTAGNVTFHANNAFASARFEIIDKTSHHSILLDVSAQTGASSAELAVLPQAPQPKSANARGYLQLPPALKGEMAYITLTRFAEQQLYAPKRLRKNPYGITLVRHFVQAGQGIGARGSSTHLLMDGSTVAVPWASWQANGYTVTAVMVRNLLPTRLSLTHALPLLCGRESGTWKAVTFFPRWTLGARGENTDTTMALLISTTPFSVAFKDCGGTQ